MKLTREECITESIELWTWLAEMGKEKKDWPGWEQYGGCDEVYGGCFLCEYTSRKYTSRACDICPYFEHFGVACFAARTPYSKWCSANREGTKKKYAQQFLEQLKQL